MKKTLNSGKIWALLPALFFFMTCGVFITYAATSSGGGIFSQWKTASGGGMLTDDKLTASGWDDLMDALNRETIPNGAIMAFYADECPDGWTKFNGANGRFLMGADSPGDIGGNEKINIGIENLPKHSHYIAIPGSTSYSDVFLSSDTSHNLSMVATRQDGQGEGNSHYDLKGQKREPTVGLTSSTGNGATIPIMNPYVKVLYCIKGVSGTSSLPEKTVTFVKNGNGLLSSSSLTAPIYSPISYSTNTVRIGGNTVTADGTTTVVGSETKGYYFSSWEKNECGYELDNDCTIKANFELGYHKFVMYPDASTDPDYINCKDDVTVNTTGADIFTQTELEGNACYNAYCEKLGGYNHAPYKFYWSCDYDVGSNFCVCSSSKYYVPF